MRAPFLCKSNVCCTQAVPSLTACQAQCLWKHGCDFHMRGGNDVEHDASATICGDTSTSSCSVRGCTALALRNWKCPDCGVRVCIQHRHSDLQAKRQLSIALDSRVTFRRTPPNLDRLPLSTSPHERCASSVAAARQGRLCTNMFAHAKLPAASRANSES